MQEIASIAELESLYGAARPDALAKVARHLTPAYRQWISQARFVVLTTVGPDGTDASPRGDSAAVVRIAGDTTLLLPDWRGNNRLDSLRNIVTDGRASLLFMVPGSNNVVRVNGTAVVTADAELTQSFMHDGKVPRCVIVVTVREVYFQFAKALRLSRLWDSADESVRVPTEEDFVRESTQF
ncbi:pyridoxamine 5'-phosphate oxidase family protein [Altererythrobacter xixiisoli]|uniref:Pyridoxamine 5'-phosphate oxidase family protein n=1 Tax=Croceibacterium xixiisoli TaxID=1476466 RepID=A0A6I4TXF5_9SPHN|nr:MSMEG_1061 family FMN-dependent PPOX-type flavoprotein [Croceibacterium xixiisoli]MXO99849.1 pyridoxamine 5'-phosphate oxidase family protein [Croceibacterium xixiisoli]